jgi:simple sugar transport system permease protein
VSGGRRSAARALAAVRAPVAAVAGALAAGAVLLLAAGYDPLAAYAAMLRGAALEPSGFGQTLGRATPIAGMALAAAVAFRAGFYNLGGEGQMVLGGLTAAVAALYLPLPAPLLPAAALAAGALAGGAWAALAAAAWFRFGVPLLIGTLLLNYPARLLASYLVNHPLRDVDSGLAQTFRVPAAAQLPLLYGPLRLHAGMLLVLALAAACAVLLARTRAGFHVRIGGLNPRFAAASGVDLRRLGTRVSWLSGAVAGLTGAVEVLAVHHRYIDEALTTPLHAWTGLMAALLAGFLPLGAVAVAVLFAAVQTGGSGMERQTDVPREMSRVLQALILLLVAARIRMPGGEARPGGPAA